MMAMSEGSAQKAAVKLSHGEVQLLASIIEHVYPDPKAGTVLPVDPAERRAASGLARKGLVVLGVDGRGFDQMTFTEAGQSIYEQQLAESSRQGQAQ